MNPYFDYYTKQAQYGGGLTGFSGVRVQRGHGWFSRMISGIGSFVKDLLPSIGKRALPSAINLASDVIAGENVAESAKKRLKEAGRNVADETLDRIKSKIQSGSGIRSRELLNDSYFMKNLGKNIKKSKKLNKNKNKKNKSKS